MSILIFLLIIVAILAGVVAMQPSEFLIARSTTISAPAAAIFPHVNNLRNWKPWSPWAKLDPDSVTEYEGPAEGDGAVMRWEGKKTGKGMMTIIESRPYDYVGFRLEFLKPMVATNTAEFIFKQEGSQTHVTWSMSGTNNFVGKAMGLLMNCDKMVGTQFQNGLTSLKNLVESGK